MDAMVVYSSVTGNTRKVANEIFAAIPGDKKDIQSIEEYNGKDADTFFVGFWTDRGTCSADIIDLLSCLQGKNVALFGTCGMGRNQKYYDEIRDKVKVFIPDDCRYLGTYMCQGKMPIQVRRKYEQWLTGNPHPEQVKRMIQNFDEALLHPDREDLKKAAAFAVNMMELAKQNIEI